ncbi:O-antigen ligase [Rhizobacter sp. OV335]|uniref:O-antigen ligase family protein n=1 Tax=Rhizobacter sp. OV335 TaxID=1500264 RepID=UPI0009F90E91|nr:O-antigen ligase family protein [Rhizobacter sp. OV335]
MARPLLGSAALAMRKPSALPWPPIAWFLVALPHFAIPLWGPYRPPGASLFLLLWAGIACCMPATLRLPVTDGTGLRWKLLAFLCYGLLSSAYGYWELSRMHQLTLHLSTGDVGYEGVAGQRLFQLVLAILAFEVVRLSRTPPVRLMLWWLTGMAVAVALQVFTYMASSDSLVQRAGIFTEGNQGGLYYLLSVFVALEYRRRGRPRAGLAFTGLATAGILLAGSSAAILVLALTLSLAYVLSGHGMGAKLRRTLLTIGTVASIAALMYGTGSDFGIAEKLFEEEVTSKSFSRIDRLASIDTAIDLFLQSPWLGHGLQTYGFLSNDYLDGPLLAMYDESFRRIPNNIYAELASEMGVVGFLLFGLFMASLVRRIATHPADKGRNLLAAVLAVLCYWLAFPTYSVVFIWAFFGLALVTLRAGPTPQ